MQELLHRDRRGQCVAFGGVYFSERSSAAAASAAAAVSLLRPRRCMVSAAALRAFASARLETVKRDHALAITWLYRKLTPNSWLCARAVDGDGDGVGEADDPPPFTRRFPRPPVPPGALGLKPARMASAKRDG